jgi:hypothetical protein
MFKKVIFYFIGIFFLYNTPVSCTEHDSLHDSLIRGIGQNRTNQDEDLLANQIDDDIVDIVPPNEHFDVYAERDHILNKEIVDWADKDVLNPKNIQSKCGNAIISGIGYYSGLSRGALYLKLGYDLSTRIIHISRVPDVILSTIYGLGVAAPMTVLGLESSGDFIKNILKKKSSHEEAIEVEEGKFLKCSQVFIIKPLLGGISLISASTVTYLTYYEFNDYIGWFWLIPGVPNFYTRSAMDYLAIPIVAKTIYREIKRPIDRYIGEKYPGSRRDNITFIKDKLEEAENYIFSLSDEDANIFLRNFTQSNDVITKIMMLTKPQLFDNNEPLNIHKRNTFGRKLSGAVGGAIGIIGLWIYLPATENAFNLLLPPICNLIGECPRLLEDGLAYTALTSATSIMSLAAASCATKFYDAIARSISKCKSPPINQNSSSVKSHSSLKRAGAAGVSALLASWNASQATEVGLNFLDMREVGSQVALTASLLSFFSLSFWSVDEKFLQYLKSNDPRIPLLNKLGMIEKKVDDMADEHLISLKDFLKSIQLVRK